MVGEHRRTFNIHIGSKLSYKSRDEILEETVTKFEGLRIMAVQQFLVIIRVPLTLKILQSKYSIFLVFVLLTCGVAWMMAPLEVFTSGGFPYEEDVVPIETLFKTCGKVKRDSSPKVYIPRIFMGTYLMDIVIERTIPRLVSINGYICKVWYKGQQIICSSCGAQGNKANECPDKDKCHRCGETGHHASH